MVRTRIAPSPTGQDIHIGNLYTALINWAFAKKNNGSFIVRIEDTDRTRYQAGAEEKILTSLKKYGLQYQESTDIGGKYAPYRQSERLTIYRQFAEELISKEKAYYCFCSSERLDKLRQEHQALKKIPKYDKYCLQQKNDAKKRVNNGEKHVIRLNVYPNRKISFIDIIRGSIEFDSNQLDDQILMKSDGFPTYHLGVVVDDHLMEISHVIRAEEWISSTPKHILLYEAFGWELPVFAHLPILRNPDRSKLSKRKNPVWAAWYLEQGFLPAAVLNFLTLMGWSHPVQKEIFPLSEFIQLLKLEDIHPVGPVFDLTKLTWMNQQYIQRLSDDELMKQLKEYFVWLKDDGLLKQLLPLIKDRMQTLKDFEELAGHFFTEPNITPRNEKEKEIAIDLERKFTTLEEWKKEILLVILKEILLKYEIRMPVLYYLITGKEKGLPLPESLEIMGKEKTLARISNVKFPISNDK